MSTSSTMLRTFGRRATSRQILALTRRHLATNGKESLSSSLPTATRAGATTTVTAPTPKHILSPYEKFVVKITRSHTGPDAPTTMGPEAMDRANSRFRIGLMAAMMIITLGVCLYAIQQGKNEKAAHSREMVYAKNRDRYKQQ